MYTNPVLPLERGFNELSKAIEKAASQIRSLNRFHPKLHPRKSSRRDHTMILVNPRDRFNMEQIRNLTRHTRKAIRWIKRVKKW